MRAAARVRRVQPGADHSAPALGGRRIFGGKHGEVQLQGGGVRVSAATRR